MKVLLAASECVPFISSGGLGDVAGSLPKALKGVGIDCRVVLPLYSDIAQEYRAKMKQVATFEVPVAWRTQYCGLFSLRKGTITYYFIDNEYYFRRQGIYGFFDDAERFAFFSRAVLEMINYIDWVPDIIHSNDWQTALINPFINCFYRHDLRFYGIKTLFTIHNIQYQGKYGLDIAADVLGIPPADISLFEYGGCINFMKAAIESADKISTVSPSYALEILDPWFSHGLDGILRERQYKLCGILNGIDTDVYNPEKDPYIAKHFSADNPAGKADCKKVLIQRFQLADDDAPIVGMVTRLVAHKGIDLVKHVLEYMLLEGIKVVVLGSGEYMYENCFRDFNRRFPDRCGVQLGFVPELARIIYAGSDLYLMPSKSEPCGLAQMIALRYGTVPIVRLTGGLKDSIIDYGDENGNGFTFRSYNAHDMLHACYRAKSVYEDKAEWPKLVERAMRCDFSWNQAAMSYLGLFDEMMNLW